MKRNNQNNSNSNKTTSVIFRLVAVKKNESGKIEYIVFRDLKGNTIHLKNNNDEREVTIKYIEVEIIEADYNNYERMMLDARVISSIKPINENTVIEEVHQAFNLMLDETSGNAREVVRATQNLVAKMVVLKLGIQENTNKVRYRNVAGHVIDLNPRKDGNDSVFVELTFDVDKYKSFIEEGRRKYPANSYFKFFSTCLVHPYVEYLDKIDENELDDLMHLAWENEGENGVYYGYEGLKRRFSENLEFNEPQFSIPQKNRVENTQSTQIETVNEPINEQLNKRQLAQRARREREVRERELRNTAQSQNDELRFVSLPMQEYELILSKLSQATAEVTILTNRISYLENIYAKTTEEVRKIHEEKEVLRQRLQEAEEKMKIARNFLGTDLELFKNRNS